MKRLGLIDLTTISRRSSFLRVGMKLIQANLWTGKNRQLRQRHPWFDRKKNNVYWIPVNQKIEQEPGVPVPQEVVRRFIEASSYRTIVDFCGCRRAFECKHYPADIGCLMMGEDARQINSKLSRPVSRAEAIAHLEKAAAAGLPPIIGKARLDDFIFGIRNTGRLLTVCFCCECCCLTRWFKYSPIEETGKSMHRLEGLEISVDEDKCTQCQTCQDHCFLDLISFDGGTPIISEHCMGCGRCASACPNDAIQIRLNNPDFVERAVQSISSYVKA